MDKIITESLHGISHGAKDAMRILLRAEFAAQSGNCGSVSFKEIQGARRLFKEIVDMLFAAEERIKVLEKTITENEKVERGIFQRIVDY